MSKSIVRKGIILFTLISFLSCQNRHELSEKEKVIQQQENKIKSLEERLDKIESERMNRPPETTSGQETIAVKPEKKKKYFSMGSTEKEVLEIMGDPSSIYDLYHSKIYMYGISEVTFRNGKVVEYANRGANLKIRMSEDDE